jgi:hypothetical protein
MVYIFYLQDVSWILIGADHLLLEVERFKCTHTWVHYLINT